MRRRTLAVAAAGLAAALLGLTVSTDVAVMALIVGAVGGTLGLGAFFGVDRGLGGPAMMTTIGSFGGAPDSEPVA